MPIVHLAAQTKISGTLSCAKPDPEYLVDIGDREGHVFVLAKSACSWTRPMQIAGVNTKDSHDVNVVDGDDANSDSMDTRLATWPTVTKSSFDLPEPIRA